MKIINLYCKNFMSFRELELDLSNISISLIDGWNIDDNSASGSGKTSIMDSISFALFGESPRGIKSDEFINDEAKKDCIVVLDIDLEDGNVLTISRSRKPNELSVKINGESKVGTDVNETQKIIERMIKLDYNTFINSIYFTQNASQRFISANDTEKREILTKILDLGQFDEAYERCNKKLKDIDKLKDTKLSEIDAEIRFKDSCLRDIENIKCEIEKEEENKKKNIETLEVEIKALEAKNQENKNQIDTLSNFSIPEPKIPEINTKEIDKEIETLQNLDCEAPEYPKIKNTDIIQDSINSLKNKVEAKDKILSKIAKLEAQKEVLMLEIEANNKKISKFKTTGGNCPTCEQEISLEHIEACTKDLQEKNEIIKSQIKDLELSLTKTFELKGKILDIEKEVKELEKQKSDIDRNNSLLLEEYNKLQNKALRFEIDKKDNISKLNEKRNNIIKSHSEVVQRAKDEVEREKNRISKEIQRLSDSISFNNDKIQDLGRRISKEKCSESRFLSLLSDKEKDIGAIKEKIEEMQSSLEIIDRNIESLNILKHHYKNVKYYIFESTVDEINMRIKKYVDTLFGDDIRIEYKFITGKDLDKIKFETEVWRVNNQKSYKSLSDGEKKRAEICTSFALSDIVAGRSGSGLNLLMLDEIFNGLDEECRIRVVNLLEDLKASKDQIFIIDHFRSIHNLVENTIKVEKLDGISKVC